jgi:TetR/AcrR family transcriptional repressor of nem operon
MLQNILKEGIADASIRADLDIDKVSRLIIAGLEGGTLISRIERNDQGLRAAMEHLDSYIESQIRKTSKASSKNR